MGFSGTASHVVWAVALFGAASAAVPVLFDVFEHDPALAPTAARTSQADDIATRITGTFCYDAGEQYCKFCDEDSECGEGNYCYGHYCGVDCSDGQECPGGFECFPFTDDVGNIVAYQCWTYCWLYEDVEPGAELSVTPPEPKHPIPTPPKGENPDLRTLWNVSP